MLVNLRLICSRGNQKKGRRKKMKGKELALKALLDKGVKYIFGYTGGAIMPIFDEMEKQQVFKFIMSRHEQGAVFMAQGISRASISTTNPRVGVCMATSGPGAMNLVTGIADAMMDIAAPASQLRIHTETAPMRGRADMVYRYSVLDTIGAGASEIQKNIIARRGLGLPKNF